MLSPIKIWCFIVGFFIIPLSLKAQPGPNLAEEIGEYLNLAHNHPDQVPMIENRFLYQLRDSLGLTLLKSMVLKRIEENPDDNTYPDILAWNLLQLKDFQGAYIQEMALDKRNKESGFRLLNLGRLAFRNKSYRVALNAFNYIIGLEPRSRYYAQAKRERLNCLENQILESAYKESDFTDLYAYYQDYIKEFSGEEETRDVKLNLARIDIGYLGKTNEARDLLNQLVNQPGQNPEFQAHCKIELAKVDILKGLVWEAALLYGQVYHDFKEESLGQEALFEGAKIYYYTGDFVLAKSQLDVLKTATSELTSNDAIDLSLLIQKNLEDDSTGKALKVFAASELLIFQHQYKRAENILDSLNLKYPKNALGDDILLSRYRIHFDQHLYDQASLDLEKILALYPEGIWADDALFKLAELNENQFKQPKKAQELYEKLFLNYPGSFYVSEARKRYRILRGDPVN